MALEPRHLKTMVGAVEYVEVARCEAEAIDVDVIVLGRFAEAAAEKLVGVVAGAQ